MSQTNEVASQIVDTMNAPAKDLTDPKAGASTDGPTPATNTHKPDDKISSKLEILIRREAAALNRENIAKAKEADIAEKLKRIEEFELSKSSPKKAMELLGLSYDELTKSMLADGELPPEVKIKQVEDKFDKYRAEQEAGVQKAQQLAKAQAEEREKQAITNFQSEIGTYLDSNKERYELISFEGQQSLVFDVIDEHYNRTMDQSTGVGKVMSIAEASDKVEAHLEAKYDKAKSVSKVKSLWGTIPKGTKEEIVKQETITRRPPQTLTNQLSGQSARPQAKILTDEERVQKAIAYAKGLRA